MISSRAGVALRVAAVAGIAAGLTGLPAAGASAAQRITRTLEYTCAFPDIGDQTASVTVGSDIPSSIAVGQSTAHYVVTASTTAPAALALGLRGFGVSTITGTADGQAEVQAPQGDLAEAVPFDIAQLSVPLFSSFTSDATGSAPVVTFSRPGNAEIIVGNMTLHLVLRGSNGSPAFLGAIDVPCTLNSGQNDVAASFTITPAASSAPSSSPASPASPTVTTVSPAPTSPGPSPTTTSPSHTTPTPTRTFPAQSADPRPNGLSPLLLAVIGGVVALGGFGALAVRYGLRRRGR